LHEDEPVTFTIEPIREIPLVQPGDNLAELLLAGAARGGLEVENGDIFVLAQKIVSKAEARLVNLTG
jgi:coenzyme F420-0:L-glutamate ligase/coenzyme F420-1:gamma-L-glutamate ligase